MADGNTETPEHQIPFDLPDFSNPEPKVAPLRPKTTKQQRKREFNEQPETTAFQSAFDLPDGPPTPELQEPIVETNNPETTIKTQEESDEQAENYRHSEDENAMLDRDVHKIVSERPPEMREPKPGDKIVRNDLICYSCGNHPSTSYYAEPGRIRNLLFQNTICNNAHADGYPITFDSHKYVKPLEIIRKRSKT